MTAVDEGRHLNTAVEQRNSIATAHVVTPYYENAENWMSAFWDDGSLFLNYFNQLDLQNCVELACGRGRHTAYALNKIGTVTLVDVNQSNIDACKERFSGLDKIRFVVNRGNDLPNIQSGSVSALWCYDALVHFEAIDVISYLDEIARVLRNGGRALLHYSNYDVPGSLYASNPHWRNYFSRSMMLHFSQRAGLNVLEDTIMNWPPVLEGHKDLDGLILLEKP